MAKYLEVLTEPNPILRKRSTELKAEEINSTQIQTLILDLVLTMKKKDGVGIAAPQVGINKRVCIVNTNDGPIALINPVMTFQSKATDTDEEGCLSIPGIWGQVSRHTKIKVKALSGRGEKIMFPAEDLFARIIQHEIDHLDGVLFVDKAKDIRKTEPKNK